MFYKGSDCLTEMKKKCLFWRVEFFFALAYCKNCKESNRIRLRSFGMFRIRIGDLRSLRSQCIKATDESLSKVDSLVPLMHHYELLRSIIWIMVPKDSIPSLLPPLPASLQFIYFAPPQFFLFPQPPPPHFHCFPSTTTVTTTTTFYILIIMKKCVSWQKELVYLRPQ